MKYYVDRIQDDPELVKRVKGFFGQEGRHGHEHERWNRILESQGYETQVFEFVALEHTSKNKMILAVKKSGAALAAAEKRRPELLEQIAEIKRFYGLREQCLETLIQNDVARAGSA